MSQLLLCLALLTTPAGARSPKRVICIIPNLMERTETAPRTPAFTRGAEAFDKAKALYGKRRYAEAARGFLAASAHFAEARAEGNFRYALYNAGKGFETAGLAVQGRAEFEAAAEQNQEHAVELKAAGAALTNRPCL